MGALLARLFIFGIFRPAGDSEEAEVPRRPVPAVHNEYIPVRRIRKAEAAGPGAALDGGFSAPAVLPGSQFVFFFSLANPYVISYNNIVITLISRISRRDTDKDGSKL